MIKNSIHLLVLLVVFGCSVSRKLNSTKTEDADLDKLVSLMSGKFSSELQAKADTSYFNISLVMTSIWTNRTDGKWLYVEQAAVTALDTPYRQRIYHLQHPKKDVFTSDIYTIKGAMAFAGLQNNKSKRDKLTYDLIERKEGCTVTLIKNNQEFTGGTEANKCPSDLRGAKYTTTKIVLKKGELRSWDQGFDATGKQVWGATKGGYIFIRQ